MDLSKINLSSYLPTMPYVVRELFDKATNIVMNYSETEAKVVEATNDESWGPPGKLLQDLSQLSSTSEQYNEVNSILRIINLFQYCRSWECFGNVVLLKIKDIGDERIK
jgi:epsin